MLLDLHQDNGIFAIKTILAGSHETNYLSLTDHDRPRNQCRHDGTLMHFNTSLISRSLTWADEAAQTPVECNSINFRRMHSTSFWIQPRLIVGLGKLEMESGKLQGVASTIEGRRHINTAVAESAISYGIRAGAVVGWQPQCHSDGIFAARSCGRANQKWKARVWSYSDATSALDIIKNELLGDIRSALEEAHKNDQLHLISVIKCFDDCNNDLNMGMTVGEDSCQAKCATAEQFFRTLNLQTQCESECITHIKECNALNVWVLAFECLVKVDEKCANDKDYICHDCKANFGGLKKEFGMQLAKQGLWDKLWTMEISVW